VSLIIRDVLFHQNNKYKNSNKKLLTNGLYDNKYINQYKINN
jgi:hypothetical protein